MFENVLLDFCYKSGIKSMLGDFKKATFYVCFLYLVYLMLNMLPVQGLESR